MKLIDQAINLLNEATSGSSYQVNHKRFENIAAGLLKLGFKLKDLKYGGDVDTVIIRVYEQLTARTDMLDKSVAQLLKKHKFTEKSGEYFLYGTSDKIPAVKAEILNKGTKVIITEAISGGAAYK